MFFTFTRGSWDYKLTNIQRGSPCCSARTLLCWAPSVAGRASEEVGGGFEGFLQSGVSINGGRSKPMNLSMLVPWPEVIWVCIKTYYYRLLSMWVGWTPINTSYFDVNKRATFGFDPKPNRGQSFTTSLFSRALEVALRIGVTLPYFMTEPGVPILIYLSGEWNIHNIGEYYLGILLIYLSGEWNITIYPDKWIEMFTTGVPMMGRNPMVWKNPIDYGPKWEFP